jgi:hypothetical protein
MMKEFEKRIGLMFAERYRDCLVLGEYELAPTVIYAQSCVYTGEVLDSIRFKQSSDLGLSQGIHSSMLRSAPVPAQLGVIVHAHFNVLPYRPELTEQGLREVIKAEFGTQIVHGVRPVQDRIIRGRPRNGLEQTSEYAADKSHGGAKGMSRQPFDHEANPDGLPADAWITLINGYAALMGARAKRLPLTHNFAGTKWAYALRPSKTKMPNWERNY